MSETGNVVSLVSDRSGVSVMSKNSSIISFVSERSRVPFMSKNGGITMVRRRGEFSLITERDNVMLSTTLWTE